MIFQETFCLFYPSLYHGNLKKEWRTRARKQKTRHDAGKTSMNLFYKKTSAQQKRTLNLFFSKTAMNEFF